MKARSDVSTAPTLGSALRSIRDERGWSLAEASAATGLSTSTLSKVENGKRSLTYDKLIQLAEALSVDISRLFSDQVIGIGPNEAAVGRRSVQRDDEGFVIEAGVYTYRYLAHDLVRKRFSPIVMELHARSVGEFKSLLRHEGEEHAFVLEGEVILHTEIYAPLHLSVGQSVYFDSRIAHVYLNAGPGRARILCTASVSDPKQEAPTPVAEPFVRPPLRRVALATSKTSIAAKPKALRD